MSELVVCAWPGSRLGEAIEALARRGGLSPRPVELPASRDGLVGEDPDDIGRWIEATAAALGLESEAAEASYPEVETLVRSAGPALLRLPGEGEPRFLALLGRSRRGLLLLGTEMAVHLVSHEAVRAALCSAVEAPVVSEVDGLLEEAEVPVARQSRARTAILRQRLSATRVGACWLLRLHAGAGFGRQLNHARLSRRLLELVVAHGVQYLLWLLSWWMVGRAALEGRLDRGWLLAWALLLITLVPFQLLVTWLQGRLAIGVGALLKRRLLAGVLRLEPEEVRSQGAGQHLGRVIESETLESLALTGGFLGLVSAIELLLAAAVLAAGAGGGQHALLLAAWTALSLLLCWRYLRQRRGWTEARLGMTHELVEKMVGYRTRLAQEERPRWHDAEDQALERYLDASRTMDRTAALVAALVPRGWLVLGVLGLGPAFVSGRGSPAALAVAIGGTLLAYRALRRLAAGLIHLAGAAITWKQVAPLFGAAARPGAMGLPVFAHTPRSASASNGYGRRLLEAHNLVFRYGGRGDPLLRGCNLQVRTGERLLLEGASGGGKSTLASLLSGLRHPESGLLLLGGLDRHSLGAGGWRRRVASAPQFHENHVLTGTFAFNALMGRDWPAGPEDSVEAEAVCRGLGLGELLDRMPAGLLQMVGESGWQLSHGERSRLYIARALLQGADVVLLDESFASLDPENLQRALRYVLDRAETLLVIAHP